MIVIIMISLILYLIVAFSTYKAMPEIEKQKKLIYILVGIVIILLITFIFANIALSKENIQEKEKLNIAKQTAIYLIAPINSLILMPIGNSISKAKGKRIKKEQLKKRLLIWIFVFIIFIVFIEQSYIRNFVEGLLVSRVWQKKK